MCQARICKTSRRQVWLPYRLTRSKGVMLRRLIRYIATSTRMSCRLLGREADRLCSLTVSALDRIHMYDILQSHGVQLASNQVEYSLLRTLPEDSGLFAAMKERGIALLACTSTVQRVFPPQGSSLPPNAPSPVGNSHRLSPRPRPSYRQILGGEPTSLGPSILQHANARARAPLGNDAHDRGEARCTRVGRCAELGDL